MLVIARARVKIAKLTKVKGLTALVVFTLLSSVMQAHVRVFTTNDGLIELTLLVNEVTSGGWANRTFSRVPPEEVRDTVSRLQYVPDDEKLPYEAMEMEPDPRKPPFISARKPLKTWSACSTCSTTGTPGTDISSTWEASMKPRPASSGSSNASPSGTARSSRASSTSTSASYATAT